MPSGLRSACPHHITILLVPAVGQRQESDPLRSDHPLHQSNIGLQRAAILLKPHLAGSVDSFILTCVSVRTGFVFVFPDSQKPGGARKSPVFRPRPLRFLCQFLFWFPLCVRRLFRPGRPRFLVLISRVLKTNPKKPSKDSCVSSAGASWGPESKDFFKPEPHKKSVRTGKFSQFHCQ